MFTFESAAWQPFKIVIFIKMKNLGNNQKSTVIVVDSKKKLDISAGADFNLWHGDVEGLLKSLPEEPIFDLVVTSPPYNIGKAYEDKVDLKDYLAWQKKIIDLIVPRVKNTGSICWQVGNYVENGQILPLDIEIAPIFKEHNLALRNRIIWHFGHGLHNKHRFSGRYEVILWYSKTDKYVFNLDDVRIPSKYPGKRHSRGPRAGELSSNPLGKNPEDFWGIDDCDTSDVWDIPNVKSNHVEKTEHPCQFPVGLIQRLVKALTNKNAVVFDPFAGVGSAGVAAALHERKFWGAELSGEYIKIAKERIAAAAAGKAKYRPYDKPIYDHTKSKLSKRPE